jgi:prepilin-type N-terminal cleavage/methylation domain-containing protein/prepilin-type processing-associated H-X9-DG protein
MKAMTKKTRQPHRFSFSVTSHVHRGFTLIEILVVIAIIVLLVAILFPVFSRARENARRASCMSNMKQLALSVTQYAADNDGKLMSYNTSPGYTSNWNRFSPIQPYIKNYDILFCPSAPRHPNGSSDSNGTTSAWAPQYGFPTDEVDKPMITAVVNVGTPSAPSSYHPTTTALDSVPNASLTCLLGETNYLSSTNTNYLKYGYGGTAFGARGGSSIVKWLNRDRHMEGANYAYMDGHVKWLKEDVVDRVYATQGTGASEAEAATLPIVFAWDK